MSGALSAGLVRHFPDRFSSPSGSNGRVPVPAAATGGRLPETPTSVRWAPERSSAATRTPEPSPAPVVRTEEAPTPSHRAAEPSSRPENESGGRMTWRSTFRNAVFSNRAEAKR